MRILQITAFSGWGCTGRIAQGICETLMEQGHEAAIAWGRINTAPEEIHTIRIGGRCDQLIHGLYTRVTDRCGFGSKRVTKEFLKKIDEFHPDIVHLHILHGYYINLEVLFQYLKEKKIPVVWTFHDCWAFTGHCPYFDTVSCEKWMEGCHHCEQKLHHPKSVLLDSSKMNYLKKKQLFTGIENLTIVTPSNWLKGLVEKSFFRNCSVKMIHNGIDTTKFKPMSGNVRERYQIPANKKILLGVSSTWVAEKGIKDFNELSRVCREEYQVVLVGLSAKQLRTLPKTVVGIARTDSVEELAQLYTEAYAFLNLTYEDNYPTTNLEAMTCGTPVITYRTGGSVESVEETGFGYVVEQGNISAVMNAVRKIKELQGRKPSVELFEQRERFKEYITLYQCILEKGKNV